MDVSIHMNSLRFLKNSCFLYANIFYLFQKLKFSFMESNIEFIIVFCNVLLC